MDHKTNSKKHLLFLTVNCSYSHSSLALPLLHSACGDLSDWEWFRYDMTIASDVLSAVRDIAAYKCDLLVTDLYLFNRQTAMDVLTRYHTLDKDCRIAVGGPECLNEGGEELLKKYPFLDCVFRGEGEEVFREYLEHFDDETFPAHSMLPVNSNAVYKNWANSPYPVEDEFFVVDKPFVQIETSRGCPMRCFYCTSGNTLTRYRSLEQVRKELQLLQKKGVKEVRVLDRTFNLPQERGRKILQLFREEFSNMCFHLELHPQFLGNELREELKKALPGQLHIEVGIQCLDPMVQQLSGRCSEIDKVLDGMNFLASQSNFAAHADLLAGLPGETFSNILADTAKLMELDTEEIQLEILKVLPGTPMRQVAWEHGILFNPSAPYDVMQSNTMSLQDIQYARDLSRLLDLTYNHKSLHAAVFVMQSECRDLVKKLLAYFHEVQGSSSSVWDLKKRFLFLLDFCNIHDLSKSKRALAYQWLLAGFPQQQGPDEYSCKAEFIPQEAQYLCGAESCLGERESRYWQFELADKKYFLAYNRKYALNRPAGIWVI